MHQLGPDLLHEARAIFPGGPTTGQVHLAAAACTAWCPGWLLIAGALHLSPPPPPPSPRAPHRAWLPADPGVHHVPVCRGRPEPGARQQQRHAAGGGGGDGPHAGCLSALGGRRQVRLPAAAGVLGHAACRDTLRAVATLAGRESLALHGHWCNAVDPRTGMALHGARGARWGEVAAAHALLGYERRDAGVCPVVLHPTRGEGPVPLSLLGRVWAASWRRRAA